jgi:hypothetical protein
LAVITRGDRELSTQFEEFPSRARDRLKERIYALTARLEERIQAAAPVRTGLLRTEIKSRTYDDAVSRIAGYVSVQAGSRTSEYAKAATLEYGSNKARKRIDRTGSIMARFDAGGRNIARRISKTPHIEAFRYLRGPLEEMRDEIEGELNQAIADVVSEESK